MVLQCRNLPMSLNILVCKRMFRNLQIEGCRGHKGEFKRPLIKENNSLPRCCVLRCESFCKKGILENSVALVPFAGNSFGGDKCTHESISAEDFLPNAPDFGTGIRMWNPKMNNLRTKNCMWSSKILGVASYTPYTDRREKLINT